MEEKVVVEVPAPLDTEKKAAPAGFQLTEISKWARFPSPVKSSSSKQNKSGFRMPLLSVQVVLRWAFLLAFALAVALGIGAVMVSANITIPSSQTPKFFRCPHLTPAQAADVDFFFEAYMWFTVPEGVFATVGLLLPRSNAGGRWSLAVLAIFSATVAHSMNAKMVFVYVTANPRGAGILLCGAAVVYLVVDLLGLLSLLMRGSEPIEA